MQTQLVSISKVRSNENNPRIIKDKKFKKLVKSIKEFPEMLQLRPIVVNEENVVLGGNMRLAASKQAGLKEIYIIKAKDLTESQQREFIIKDNIGYGEWDWDLLANEWDNSKLGEWGLDVWQPELEDNSNYIPEYSPSFDNKQLSEEEFEKRKELLNSKEYQANKDFITCICPNCFNEFNIEKPK